MSHCDDDELSIIALGEPASSADDAHLQECSRCRSRLDQLTAVVGSARSITDDDRPITPPADVWAGITAELGLTGTGTVTSLDAARRRRGGRTWAIAGAAAAVGLVLGGIVTAGVLKPPSSAQVLAQASLAPIADSGFAGTAVVEQRDGHAVLRVQVPDLPQVEDGYYEVWMATPDTTTMVAIGTMNPGEDATFDLPAGMDMTSFPVVDVSVEHFDGNTEHSAVSVVRGQLQA